MRIKDIQIHHFSLPFKTPIHVGKITNHFRQGYILAISDGDYTGFGEIAPLPGLDAIDLENLLPELEHIKSKLQNQRLHLARFNPELPNFNLMENVCSSKFHVQFGIESALLWLVQYHLSNWGDQNQSIRPVHVNGLFIPNPDQKVNNAQIKALKLAGFNTIKIKIGRNEPEQEIPQILQFLESAHINYRIRLDGNRSLNLKNYKMYYKALKKFDVEYVEEPLTYNDFKKGLEVPWNLAIDESINQFFDVHRPSSQHIPSQIKAIIIKPGTIPGLHSIYRIASAFLPKGITPVLSSAFNTGIGILTMGLIALTCNGIQHTAHGLDTLKYLKHDLLTEPLRIKNGQLHFLPSFFKNGIFS